MNRNQIIGIVIIFIASILFFLIIDNSPEYVVIQFSIAITLYALGAYLLTKYINIQEKSIDENNRDCPICEHKMYFVDETWFCCNCLNEL